MYLTRYIAPEAVGYLVRESICCGKPRCRCWRGQRHGPYWYLHFRRLEDGVWRPRKLYVTRDVLPAVRQQIEQTKAQDRAAVGLLGESRQLRAEITRHRRSTNTKTTQGASQ